MPVGLKSDGMTGQTTGHLKVDTPRAIVPSLSTCDGWAQYFAECGLRNVESCQGVICGKCNADFFLRNQG